MHIIAVVVVLGAWTGVPQRCRTVQSRNVLKLTFAKAFALAKNRLCVPRSGGNGAGCVVTGADVTFQSRGLSEATPHTMCQEGRPIGPLRVTVLGGGGGAEGVRRRLIDANLFPRHVVIGSGLALLVDSFHVRGGNIRLMVRKSLSLPKRGAGTMRLAQRGSGRICCGTHVR